MGNSHAVHSVCGSGIVSLLSASQGSDAGQLPRPRLARHRRYRALPASPGRRGQTPALDRERSMNQRHRPISGGTVVNVASAGHTAEEWYRLRLKFSMLCAGNRLGPYEILALLNTRGMGEV